MNGDPTRQTLGLVVSPEGDAQETAGEPVKRRRGRPPKVRPEAVEASQAPDPKKRTKGRKSFVSAMLVSQGITTTAFGRDGRPRNRRRILQHNPV